MLAGWLTGWLGSRLAGLLVVAKLRFHYKYQQNRCIVGPAHGRQKFFQTRVGDGGGDGGGGRISRPGQTPSHRAGISYPVRVQPLTSMRRRGYPTHIYIYIYIIYIYRAQHMLIGVRGDQGPSGPGPSGQGPSLCFPFSTFVFPSIPGLVLSSASEEVYKTSRV